MSTPDNKTECPAGLDFSDDVRTTLVVSVTVKIDAHGSTPDELITHAVMSADSLIEGALAAKYPEVNGRFVWATHSAGQPVVSTISVEGATALVNREALDTLFKEES